MDYKKVGGALGRIGAGFSAMSPNQKNREAGLARIASYDAQEDATTKTAQAVQLKILDASLKALSSGNLDQAQAGPVIENSMRLAKGLGVDIGDPASLFVPKQVEDVRVGNTIARKGADGLYEPVFTAPDTKAQRPINVPPQGQVLSPDGKTLLYENKNKRSSGAAAKPITPRYVNVIYPDKSIEMIDANNKEEVSAAKSRKGVFSTAVGATERQGGANAYDFQTNMESYEKSGDLNDLYRAAISAIDADPTTNADRAKRKGAIKSRVTGVNAFRATAERLSSVIAEDPTVITDAAKVAGLANNFMNETKAAMNILVRAGGFRIDPEKGLDPDNYPVMRQIQTGSREVKTMILNMALASAAAQGLGSGRDLSNADVERAIDQIGGGSKDPAVLLSGVDSAYQGMLTFLEEQAKTEAGIIDIDDSPIEQTAPTRNVDSLVEQYRTK